MFFVWIDNGTTTNKVQATVWYHKNHRKSFVECCRIFIWISYSVNSVVFPLKWKLFFLPISKQVQKEQKKKKTTKIQRIENSILEKANCNFGDDKNISFQWVFFQTLQKNTIFFSLCCSKYTILKRRCHIEKNLNTHTYFVCWINSFRLSIHKV